MVNGRIAIVGAGAVGASIAADLTRGGLDVTVIEPWPEHVEAMRSGGVRIEVPGDEATTTQVRAFHVSEVATLRESYDVVIVVVKAYDTRWACELIKPLVRPDGIVVGIQNGMTIDDMASIMGPERTLGAVVEIAANMFQPGVVKRQTPSSGTWFTVGVLHESARGREARLAEFLSHAGTADVTDDIRSSKWMKLVANAAEFVTSAMVNLPLADAVRLPGMRQVMDAAGSEAMETALALGHRVVPMFGKPGIEDTAPEHYAAALFDAVLSGWTLPDTRVAILHDWLKGRRGEADAINGLVVSEQRRLGGRARTNEVLVEFAHRIERGELAPDPSNLELLLSELGVSAPVSG
jgi:2-dehydropantoate 2-reductase